MSYAVSIRVTPDVWRLLLTADGQSWVTGKWNGHRWVRWIVPRMIAGRILDEPFRAAPPEDDTNG